MNPLAISKIRSCVTALTAILTIAGGLFVGIHPADAKDIAAYGGPGGEPFESRCHHKDALIGINLRSGTALDAVTAICISLDEGWRNWSGKAYEPTQYWGGGGGGYQKVACKPGHTVKQLKVSAMKYGNLAVVNSVSIRCRNLQTGYEYDVAPTRAGTILGKRNQTCSRGIANGIHGAYGTFVDRIGIACY